MSNEDVTLAVAECARRIEELGKSIVTSKGRRKPVSAIDMYVELVQLSRALVRENFIKDSAPCPVDCGDQSCLCAFPKTGVRTNGGCRCNETDLRRAVVFWKRIVLGL